MASRNFTGRWWPRSSGDRVNLPARAARTNDRRMFITRALHAAGVARHDPRGWPVFVAFHARRSKASSAAALRGNVSVKELTSERSLDVCPAPSICRRSHATALAANARDISAVSAGRHLLLGRSSVRVNAPPSPLSFLVCPRRGRRPSRDGSRSPPPSHAERGDGWNDTLEESFRPRRRSARIQTQARVSCTASPSGREAPASFP